MAKAEPTRLWQNPEKTADGLSEFLLKSRNVRAEEERVGESGSELGAS